MSERLLTPMTHGPAQPVLTYIKIKIKNRLCISQKRSGDSFVVSNREPEGLQDTCKSFRHGLKKYIELITTPDLSTPAPDIHLNDLQKQGFSANQERNPYQPYDIKFQNKVTFDLQPTNPQADIVDTGRCEYLITEAPRKGYRIPLR